MFVIASFKIKGKMKVLKIRMKKEDNIKVYFKETM